MLARMNPAQSDDAAADLPPWLAKLSPETRAAVARFAAAAPPLTDRQRERLRLLFRRKAKTQ